MKLNVGSKKTKGMLFAGCSFTWGQGLYYYSGLDTLKQPPINQYKQHFVTLAHERYMESLRFPRLVANHFDAFELCQPFNGGASYSIHDWWRRCFMSLDDPNKTYRSNFKHNIPTYHYSEVSHVFYQFTQWHRAQSSYKPGEDIITHSDALREPGFKDWLVEQNLTLNNYEILARKKEIYDVKKFLMEFDRQGIKTYVMCWPYDMSDDILNDSWLSSRFITFNYKEKHYNDIESMMIDGTQVNGIHINPELTIIRDYENFEVPPQDDHPSRLCHRVIADNIINYLEKGKK